MTSSGQPHEIRLTVEEALELLDIMLVSPVELTSHQDRAMQKLSEFCRNRLRAVAPHESSVWTGRARRRIRLCRKLRDIDKLGRLCPEPPGKNLKSK